MLLIAVYGAKSAYYSTHARHRDAEQTALTGYSSTQRTAEALAAYAEHRSRSARVIARVAMSSQTAGRRKEKNEAGYAGCMNALMRIVIAEGR
jgi:hypothetical protein